MMPWNRADVRVQLDEQEVHRVRGEEQRCEYTGEIEEGLDGMHG